MGLSRRQKLALKRSTATVNIWYGSVRSSKTFGSLWDFIRVMTQRSMNRDNEGVVLLVGLSTNTVWRNIFQPLLNDKQFAAFAPYVEYRQNAPSGRFLGQPFSVVGANNEASWLSIQGLTVAYCLGDEATGWPKSFWDMLLTRLSLSHSRLLVTCNPGAPTHYLKKVIDRQGTDPDVHTEKFLLHENPTLAPSVVRRLKRSFTGLFYRRMIKGEWVAAEGAVFEGWDPQTMTVDPRTLVGPQGSAGEGQVRLVEALALGIDYGTQHPTAGELLCLGSDGRMYITHEWAPNPGNKRLTDKQLADRLETFLQQLDEQGLRPRFIYADPAGASFREELHQRGINTTRADNDVISGIATVDAALTAGDLKVSTACRRLVDEIPSYRWDEKAAERGVDKPIKEEDDYVDGFRYAVFSSRHLWRRHVG